jgi:hypothetical protein
MAKTKNQTELTAFHVDAAIGKQAKLVAEMESDFVLAAMTLHRELVAIKYLEDNGRSLAAVIGLLREDVDEIKRATVGKAIKGLGFTLADGVVPPLPPALHRRALEMACDTIVKAAQREVRQKQAEARNKRLQSGGVA